MTIAEMSRAWNVSETEIEKFLPGVTITQKAAITGADLIPWDDVINARKFFWLPIDTPNELD